ncbi:MAG: Rrf2 family transcriptional regulator [Oligoflexia bacterium]|nr:Rrf2 family transcriptional regulator [Oligoflexia bacterium]
MLELTTKYALQALRTLERLEVGEFIQVKELSRLAKVPGPYLAKIVKVLAAKGLVLARRGKHGGVRLAEGAEFSFLDVCVALDDPVLEQTCFFSKSPCSQTSPCAMHGRWTKLRQEVDHFLREAKIQTRRKS